MKKKFAYILKRGELETNLHKAKFENKKQITYIITVNDLKEACQQAIELKNDGVGVIELCESFNKLEANKIIKATNNKVGVGYVINDKDQFSLFNSFFKDSNKIKTL